MVLGSNVKHLVIVIPNEGHHGPGEEDEARFIAQPFLPQNAIVGPGTQVAWFNGDVGHEHNIVVRDANGAQLFETGEFTEWRLLHQLHLTLQEILNMLIQWNTKVGLL